MDLGLVEAVAALRPRWTFDMIGPVVKIDPATLPQRDNIRWLGPRAYADLPEMLAQWDVGIMPFALNEATRFISPTKTPEFLAAGLPVVSTPITDVVRSYGQKGLVEIAATPQGFVEAAAMLLDRPREAWLQAVDRQLAAGSWDQTWAEMLGHMSCAMRAGQTLDLVVGSPTISTPAFGAAPGQLHSG
jgi:UDP-galactopyranose mutase